MKTYLKLTMDSEGASPMEIASAVQELGFATSLGQHDFVYDWGRKKELDVELVLALVERVHRRLKGMKVLYEITTVQ